MYLVFYKKKVHFKADCYKYKAMMNGKNISLVFVSFMSNLVDVP